MYSGISVLSTFGLFSVQTASSFGRNARIASSFTITLISKIASKINKANS